MKRHVPPALLAHLQSRVTTMTSLWRIEPVSGPAFGLTTLDQDVTYDGLTYGARRGYTPSATQSTADLSVDNGEMEVLLGEEWDVDAVTDEMIQRGYLDNARWTELRVNYEDLSMGHYVRGSGVIGEMRTRDGMVAFLEARSLSQVLKQTSIIDPTSISCRSEFGNREGNHETNRRFCGYDLTGEWVDGVVTDVGIEEDRVFTALALDQPADFFAPGMVEWLTGENAGRSTEVEAFAAGVVMLWEPTPGVIVEGDTFRIRRDCPKTPEACKAFGNYVNYNGEPDMPVATGDALGVPGAS